MTNFLMDDPAIELLRKELIKEKAFAMRIFIGGGGCCKRFELIPVKKALAGDITFMKGGVRILVEKEIAENTSGIRIKYDEHKGLLIDLT
jgi:Fe-S cluster assembly iron-binding protein IscA